MSRGEGREERYPAVSQQQQPRGYFNLRCDSLQTPKSCTRDRFHACLPHTLPEESSIQTAMSRKGGHGRNLPFVVIFFCQLPFFLFVLGDKS